HSNFRRAAAPVSMRGSHSWRSASRPSRPGPPANVHDVVIAGCGSRLRADDGAGPALVRRIRELGSSPRIQLADAMGSGIDVALALEGAAEAVVVDACRTGRE